MGQESNPSGSWLIISDVHLGGFDDEKNLELMEEFADVINFAIVNKLGIIVNGDLFDYYMEYHGMIPPVVEEGTKILNSYFQATQKSPVFITGNHDNWDDGYLSKNGCLVEHEAYVTVLGTDRVLIAHGDGLKNPDFGFPRPLMHRILRNSYFINVYKLLTDLPTGNWIMKWFSRFNRRFDADNARTTKRIDDWALKMLQYKSFDVVITAHHHNPRFQKFSNKLYLNSGCFYRDRTMILYTNNRFELVRWDNQTQMCIPFKSGNLET